MRKNNIYGIKKEVAIMAQPPYYCLFAQKGHIGSIHDFQILKVNFIYQIFEFKFIEIKKTHESYHEYLVKTPEEMEMVPQDRRTIVMLKNM